MKPRLMAILVIGILAVSMILTLAGAINQTVSGDAGGPERRTVSPAGDGTEAGEGKGPNALGRSFKFVCPFH